MSSVNITAITLIPQSDFLVEMKTFLRGSFASKDAGVLSFVATSTGLPADPRREINRLVNSCVNPIDTRLGQSPTFSIECP